MIVSHDIQVGKDAQSMSRMRGEGWCLCCSHHALGKESSNVLPLSNVGHDGQQLCVNSRSQPRVHRQSGNPTRRHLAIQETIFPHRANVLETHKDRDDPSCRGMGGGRYLALHLPRPNRALWPPSPASRGCHRLTPPCIRHQGIDGREKNRFPTQPP